MAESDTDSGVTVLHGFSFRNQSIPGYVWVAMITQKINFVQLGIMAIVESYTKGPSGECWISNGRLGEILEKDSLHISKCISHLVKTGWMTVETRIVDNCSQRYLMRS